MALLGAASSAVLQAFETCGLSPTGPEGRGTWWTNPGADGSGAKAPIASGPAASALSRSSEVARRLLFCLDEEEGPCSRTPRGPGSSRGAGPAWKHMPLPPPPPEAPSPWADEQPPVGRSPPHLTGASPSSSSPPPRSVSQPCAATGSRGPTSTAGGGSVRLTPQQQRRAEKERHVEQLIEELFTLHDLNHNGVLEEVELIKLNEKIAMLHYGRDTDKRAVRDKFRTLFRKELDPHGRPVPLDVFRGYMHKVLDGLDRSPAAQELILEQFVEEAKSGRLAFHCQSFQSLTDEPFRSKIEPMYT